MQSFVYNSKVRSVIGIVDGTPWTYLYNDDIYGNIDMIWINHSSPGDVRIEVRAIRTSSILSKRDLSISPARHSFAERPVYGERRTTAKLNEIFLEPCVKLIDLSSYIIRPIPPYALGLINRDICQAKIEANLPTGSFIEYAVKVKDVKSTSDVRRDDISRRDIVMADSYSLRLCLTLKPGDIVHKTLYFAPVPVI